MYDISWETWTPESIDCGEAEDRGTVDLRMTLREAIQHIYSEVPCTTDGGHWQNDGSCLTYVPGPDWESEEHTRYSLHGNHIQWVARILNAI